MNITQTQTVEVLMEGDAITIVEETVYIEAITYNDQPPLRDSYSRTVCDNLAIFGEQA